MVRVGVGSFRVFKFWSLGFEVLRSGVWSCGSARDLEWLQAQKVSCLSGVS